MLICDGVFVFFIGEDLINVHPYDYAAIHNEDFSYTTENAFQYISGTSSVGDSTYLSVSGIFTPTEAATISVVYSMILGALYRELTVKTLLEAMKKTVATSASVAVIVGISNGFCWLLASAGIPQAVTRTLAPMLGTKTVFLFVFLGILTIVGCVMETLPSVIILGPLLVPVGEALGLDSLHLGVLFCIVLIVGLITPPFGINLFTAVATTDTPFIEVAKGAVPFMLVALLSCILFAFVPEFITFLPNLMR